MLSSAKLGFWEWAFLLCATVCPIGQHQLDTVVFTIWFACLVSGRKLGCFSAVQEDSQQLSTNCATATPLPREPSSTTTKNTSEPHSCFLQLCTNFTTTTPTPLPRGPSSTTTENTPEPHSCFLQLCTNFTTATPLPRGPGSTTTKNISQPHSCFLQLSTNCATITIFPGGQVLQQRTLLNHTASINDASCGVFVVCKSELVVSFVVYCCHLCDTDKQEWTTW